MLPRTQVKKSWQRFQLTAPGAFRGFRYSGSIGACQFKPHGESFALRVWGQLLPDPEVAAIRGCLSGSQSSIWTLILMTWTKSSKEGL